MNKSVIQIPRGIRYMSEFEEKYGFHLENFPYILDKKLPGCGFTTWVLTNKENVILASPRKMLMENKKEQLGDDIFLVNLQYPSIGVEIDKDLNKIPIQKKKDTPDPLPIYDKTELKHALSEYMLKMQMKHHPIKIIVTYDSYRKIKELLEELKIFQEFYTIVDEMQSLWVDVRFKPNTEIEFVELLKTVQRVCYVSATPMMEEYLEMVDYFKDLPYQEFDWITLEPDRVRKPSIIPRTLKSVNLAAKSIILPYKEGKFENRLYIDLKTGEKRNVESREAVIYINSVTNIIGIIKACDLKPEEVNILCSNTPMNAKRISTRLDKKRKGIEFKIGKVPLPGEPRKMFTFCTRTVYLGADFYSDNARTFIFSDANIDTLAVDVVLDLPQILGRQRLNENPWKDEATIYVKSTVKYKALSEEDFTKEINRKLNSTRSLLRSYENALEEDKVELAKLFETQAMVFNYRDNYVAVNHHAGSKPIPVFNDLVAIAERRAFDIQQKDYVDRVMILNKIESAGIGINHSHGHSIVEFLDNLMSAGNTGDKIRFLCVNAANLSELELETVFSEIPDYFRNFYLGLGPERCRALSYNYGKLKKEYETQFFDTDLVRDKLLEKFQEGDKIASSTIKTVLKDLYIELGYKKTPKASDLEGYFKVKKIKLKDLSGKWVNGFELIRKKI